MKRVWIFLCLAALLLLSSCGNTLSDMTGGSDDEGSFIQWEDRTYRPFCVVSKNDCGKRIGKVNGDKDDIVAVYLDLPPEEWIANYLTMDGGAMLWKEVNVTEIPEGLEAEYD